MSLKLHFFGYLCTNLASKRREKEDEVSFRHFAARNLERKKEKKRKKKKGKINQRKKKGNKNNNSDKPRGGGW